MAGCISTISPARKAPASHPPRWKGGIPARALRRFRRLSSHLFHELAHSGDVARRAFVHPGLKALSGFFEIREKLLVGPLFASFCNSRPDAFPYATKLAAGFKEQIVVQQAVVQQSAGLLPVAGHHHEVGAAFGSRGGNPHRIAPVVREIVLEEPVAGLAQPRFASLVKNL